MSAIAWAIESFSGACRPKTASTAFRSNEAMSRQPSALALYSIAIQEDAAADQQHPIGSGGTDGTHALIWG